MKNMIAFIIFLTALSSFADGIKILRADRAAKAPAIDGDLSEECWRNAKTAGDFTLVITGQGPAKMQTSFAVLYDDKNLYFGIECKEKEILKLKKKCRDHDGPVYADDCVEIFIDSNLDRQTYFHFIANAAGAKADWNYKDISWNPPWKAAVKENKDSWTLEIAIPLSELDIKGAPGSLLRFNVVRARFPDIVEYSCWSNTGGSFHAPGKFGWLTFGGCDDVVKYNFIPSIKKIYGDYKKILSGKGAMGENLQKELDKLCAPMADFERNSSSGDKATIKEFLEMQKILARLENFKYEIDLNLLINKQKGN